MNKLLYAGVIAASIFIGQAKADGVPADLAGYAGKTCYGEFMWGRIGENNSEWLRFSADGKTVARTFKERWGHPDSTPPAGATTYSNLPISPDSTWAIDNMTAAFQIGPSGARVPYYIGRAPDGGLNVRSNNILRKLACTSTRTQAAGG